MYSFNVLTVFYTFLEINLKCSSIVILAPMHAFLQLKYDLPPQFAHLVIFHQISVIKTHICWVWEIFCLPINIHELLSGEQLFDPDQHQNLILLVLDARILSQNRKYLLSFFIHKVMSATPWTAALQGSLSFTISWSLLKFISLELMMLSSYLFLSHPLLLLP